MKCLYSFLIVLMCSVLANAQTGKMSPYLRHLYTQHAQNARSISRPQERYTIALVKTADTSLLEANGCRVLASWDDIHISRIPLSRLQALASRPEVLRIEANAPCSLTNDTTASIVRVCSSLFMAEKVKDVRNTYGLTGKGVVIGVEDIGFDLTNPNYLSQDGSRYRVKAVWDQLDFSSGGSEVQMVLGDTLYTAPGRQYTDEASILAKGCTADSLLAYHGTHTSGTAAGSGQYCGMAPEADLCLVCNIVSENATVVPPEHLSEYTSATDLLGFKYIFDYAESQNKPCVINFSEGSLQGLYDTQLYDEVLTKMVGSGRILCASAGNQGFKGSYIHKVADEDRKGAFLTARSYEALYTLCTTQPARFSLDFYSQGGEKKTVSFDASEWCQHLDSVYVDTLEVFDSLYVVSTVVYPDCYDASRYATELYILDCQHGAIGTSALPIALTLDGTGYEAEAYASGGYFTTNAFDASLQDFTNDHNILFPGSSPSVITVGMTGHMGQRINLYGQLAGVEEAFGVGGVISGYGSKGPTMAGLMKPEVVAPGTNVVSAHSSYYYQNHPEKDDWLISVSEWNGRQYPWRLNTGTSMSTPVVVGIIALWLEQCPTLSPEDILDVFANTCRHGDATLLYPNNSWGWGEINAVAGLEYIQGHYTDIDVVKAEGSSGSKVYDLMGRRIADASTYHGIVITSDGSKVVR